MTLVELIEQASARMGAAQIAFGQGTQNPHDEAAWLTLWKLGLALDTPLDVASADSLTEQQVSDVLALIDTRITSRKPSAYLTREAWLQGVPFYVDERSIIPRSMIAELLVQADIDPWLDASTHRVLDLCTGNASLAIIAAIVYPDVLIDASDLSEDALAVARINVDRHQLHDRVRLLHSDGLADVAGPYDLILCNPPYVNAHSMATLPAEFQAEPMMALDGNTAGSDDGMDFVRSVLPHMLGKLSAHGVLVLEIGNEREYFEAAFPELEAVWLETSAGEDQVLLLTAQALATWHLPANV